MPCQADQFARWFLSSRSAAGPLPAVSTASGHFDRAAPSDPRHVSRAAGQLCDPGSSKLKISVQRPLRGNVRKSLLEFSLARATGDCAVASTSNG
jgi:hypothetical protein